MKSFSWNPFTREAVQTCALWGLPDLSLAHDPLEAAAEEVTRPDGQDRWTRVGPWIGDDTFVRRLHPVAHLTTFQGHLPHQSREVGAVGTPGMGNMGLNALRGATEPSGTGSQEAQFTAHL